MKLLMIPALTFLIGCAAKNPEAVSLVLPTRKPLKPVEVTSCFRDTVCPKDGAVVLNQQNLKNLQENVINSEVYIQQLEELIRSTQPKKD